MKSIEEKIDAGLQKIPRMAFATNMISAHRARELCLKIAREAANRAWEDRGNWSYQCLRGDYGAGTKEQRLRAILRSKSLRRK